LRGLLSLLTRESDVKRYRTGIFLVSAEPDVIAKVLPALQEHFPQVSFTCLVSRAYVELFSWLGEVFGKEEVVWIEQVKANPVRWLAALRKREFDVCVVLWSGRPTFRMSKVAAFYVKVRRIIVYDENGDSVVLDRSNWKYVLARASARLRKWRPANVLFPLGFIYLVGRTFSLSARASVRTSESVDVAPRSDALFDSSYAARIEKEKSIYTALHQESNEDLTERINSALSYVLDKVQEKVRKQTGSNVWDFVVKSVNERPGCNILSLGSGPCGTEINLAQRFTVDYILDCLDINPHLLAKGEERSRQFGLKFRFSAQDINSIALPPRSYDIVFAHAALHHFLALEHIFSQVRNALKPGGLFIAYEVIPRNGMLMWPETNEVVQRLWRLLPDRLKYDHSSGTPFYTPIHPNRNVGLESFECIRSEEIYPLLKKMFRTQIEVPVLAFTRRFVDTEFGPNYDLSRQEDRALIDLIFELDEQYLNSGKLKPVTIFMVMDSGY